MKANPTPKLNDKSTDKNWARELAHGLISYEQVSNLPLKTSLSRADFNEIDKHFHVRIPEVFVEEINKDLESAIPLVKQVMPSSEELTFFPEELEDPIGDEAKTPIEGLTHRYPDRVLIKPTYKCAVYCRFCFRRYKVSKDSDAAFIQNFPQILNYISEHKEIWEVILTGGDPLTLTDKRLYEVLAPLAAIEHVKIIRFHTRVPSVLPSRINDSLISLLKQCEKKIWMALHINSANEFTESANEALAKLSSAGIPLLLQAVLLKDVNDSKEKLLSLFKKSVENNVKPYYLHYPDLAQGTNHFRISIKKALELMKEIRPYSGLCQPHLIIDIPGGLGKVNVAPEWVKIVDENTIELLSPLTQEKKIIHYPE